jgi:hypothetical protein
VLEDDDGGALRGFSTLLMYRTKAAGTPISVVYSGDTIVERAWWGSPALASTWIRAVKQLSAMNPDVDLYWLLLTSGYRTYRFLPVFFRSFYPRCDEETSPEAAALLDAIALERFGSRYDPEAGVVRFPRPQVLAPDLLDVSKGRTEDAHVRFFLARNPGYVRGDRLVCLTRIHDDNLACRNAWLAARSGADRMQLQSAAANLLWAGSSVRAWNRYRTALRDPAVAQERLLLRYLAENADTAIGHTHEFSTMRSVEEYQARVPLTTYDELEPRIQRVARGDAGVLTRSVVTRLVPSSGSASAAKLIPYTQSLQREFSRAIGAWIVDLYMHRPRLMGGTAYWSISPAMPPPTLSAPIAAVPVGFDDDSAYLGGTRQALVRAVLAVPPDVSAIKGPGDIPSHDASVSLARP